MIHTHLRRGTRYVAQIGAGPVHFCTLHLSLNGPHYLRSDGLFCISEWQVGTVPSTYRGRLFLLPNSLVPQPRLDPERVRQLRAELGAGDDDFVIGGVGRLVRSKGFDILVRAFEAAALPAARLVIVGEGHQRRRLGRLAGRNVTLTGFRHDVKDLYQAFDLFVSPSRIEPFGRVIIEALDAGTPVVATDAQGPRDIARHLPIELVPTGRRCRTRGGVASRCSRPRQRIALDLSEFHVEQHRGTDARGLRRTSWLPDSRRCVDGSRARPLLRFARTPARAAAMVASISSSPCAAETKPASNAEGAR